MVMTQRRGKNNNYGDYFDNANSDMTAGVENTTSAPAVAIADGVRGARKILLGLSGIDNEWP